MDKITSPPYYFGQLIEYEIEIINHGPSPAYGIEIDFNTTGMIIDSFNASFCYTNVEMCNLNNLNNGGNAVFKMYVLNTSSPGLTFNITATVDDDLDYSTDPSIGNNISDTDNGGVSVAAADMRIKQTLITAPPYFIGQQINYNIDIKNFGPNLANNLVVSYNILGLSNVSFTGCDSFIAGACNVNALGLGGIRSINMSTTINREIIRNMVNVNANEHDPAPLNNNSESQNNVETDSELEVVASLLNSAPHYPGDYFQYLVKIVNNGPDIAANVVLTSLQSDGLVITDSDYCDILPCNIPTILNGEIKPILLGGFVGFPGGFDVSHEVTVMSDQNDFDQSNNWVFMLSNIEHAADVQVITSLLDNLQNPGVYVPNTPVQFEVKVRNNGSTPASQVIIDAVLTNISIIQVQANNCPTFPCQLDRLEIGANNQETLLIDAYILNQGLFGLSSSAFALEYDDLESNNYSSVSRIATLSLNDLIFEDGFE